MNNSTCSNAECQSAAAVRGLCRAHYTKQHRASQPERAIVCKWCKVDFTVSGGGRHQFCSSDCRAANLKKSREAKRAPIDPIWKHCSRCDTQKLRTTFRKDKNRADGLFPYCIDCWREYIGAKAMHRATESKAEYNRKRYQRIKAEGAIDLAACHRQSHLTRTFGITVEDYESMLVAQDYRCGICQLHVDDISDKGRGGKKIALSVDHDHSCCPGNKSCGECVRGLLCRSCNVGLGALGDDRERLRKAIEYLTAHVPGVLAA